MADWTKADLSGPDRALCEYAAKLARRGDSVTERDLDRLREAGFDDRAIHDAAQVVGFFGYATRVADGLGVEPEEFIEEWGRSREVGASIDGS